MTTHTPTPEIIESKLNSYKPFNADEFSFIVRAVNSHEELLSIIKRELEMEGSVSESEMKRAIAKAEGRI